MHSPDRLFLPHTVPRLGNNSVQVWLIEFARFSSEEEIWKTRLIAEEQERASRYRFAWDRKQYAVTRGCLRWLLGLYLGVEPLSIEIRYAEHGKPYLAAPYGDLQFNVSHSDGLALLAFGRGEMLGVDVELVREDVEVDEIAKRFFSPAEQAALARLPAEQRRQAFFRCWTRKEAFIKAIGEGLSLPLHQFDVSVDPEQPATLLATRPVSTEAVQWSLHDLVVPRGYAAALAVRAQHLIVNMNTVDTVSQQAVHP
jgi:4'-phosphopantetheinyl transferase